MTSRRHVTMFAKAPVPGRVKTRLCPPLELEDSAALHAAFIEDLGANLGEFGASAPELSLALAHAGDPTHPSFEALRDLHGFELTPQRGQGLGARLSAEVERARGEGAEQVLIIGSDSPTLPARALRGAFEALERHDVVVGPSFDGGYYLVGMSGAHVGIFEGIEWSSTRVFGQTLARCRALELSVSLLEFWYDVDDFDDLELLRAHLFEHLARLDDGKYSATKNWFEIRDDL